MLMINQMRQLIGKCARFATPRESARSPNAAQAVQECCPMKVNEGGLRKAKNLNSFQNSQFIHSLLGQVQGCTQEELYCCWS